jgi:1,4-dihydroxy-2-naphthoate octaprenyltransferase
LGSTWTSIPNDKSKGVGTLPVRLGFEGSQALASILSLSLPLLAFLAFYTRIGNALAALLPLPLTTGLAISKNVFLKNKPEGPPPKWNVWPLWYVAGAYAVMDSIGRTAILTILALGLYLRGHMLPALGLAGAGIIWELALAAVIYRLTETR